MHPDASGLVVTVYNHKGTHATDGCWKGTPQYRLHYVVNKYIYIDYNNREFMARVKANICECDGRMKRLYVRAEGGSGWDPVGWQCGCGCICMDEGEWKLINCSNDCCEEPLESSSCC